MGKKQNKNFKMTDDQRIVVINILMNDDIQMILATMEEKDYDFIGSILTGEGWTQYSKLTDRQVWTEFTDRGLFKGKEHSGKKLTDKFIKKISNKYSHWFYFPSEAETLLS